MEIKNLGSQPFSFTTALHTYFAVEDVRRIRICGLEKLNYFDKVTGTPKQQEQELLAITQATDSIYSNSPDKVFYNIISFNIEGCYNRWPITNYS